MRLRTLLLYLIGNRQAILDVAANPHAIWIGLLFVLSAGFAREYDQEDLLHEPWHLFVPLGASLLASFVLFLLLFALAKRRGARGLFLSSYRSFLGVFWMTAPLAWLYAIPFERFMTPLGATQANLLILGLVAVWRLVLMIRVVSVLTDSPMVEAIPLVLLFADGAVLAAMYALPFPIIEFMGGIQRPDHERLVRSVTLLVGFGAALLAPVLLLILAMLLPVPTGTVWKLPRLTCSPGTRVHWGAPLLATTSLLVWALVLPLTQSEQQLKYKVTRALRAGHISEGLAEMSAHRANDFPPLWDPPPAYDEKWSPPPLLEVLENIADDPPADWVQEIYLRKFAAFLEWQGLWQWRLTDQEFVRVVALLRRLPGGRVFAHEHRQVLDGLFNQRLGKDAEADKFIGQLRNSNGWSDQDR
jgi:hypothetical protein